MIRNYIVIAWRNVIRNRLFSFINIFGLALSMSVCMMVLLRVIDNFSYDSFHPDKENSYRIISSLTIKGNKTELATTPLPLAEVMEEESAIKEVVTLYPALQGNVSDGAKTLWLHAAFTQPSFFKVFGFTLKQGDATTALQHPNSIVLSESAAIKFFGETAAIGKFLTFENFGAFEVTGVLAPPPSKSHINYEAFASMSTVSSLEKQGKLAQQLSNWDTFEKCYTYVTLHDNMKESMLSGKLDQLAHTLNKPGNTAVIAFRPQPINAITPGWTELYHETSRGSSWAKLSVEIGIGFIILIAAAFNYTNLSIARALKRGKEVGIRKLSGAVRAQIFGQYILEAVMIALLALCAAHFFLALILEYKPFNDGYEMVPNIGVSIKTFLIFVVFALFSGLIAGAIPAWILSSFKPLKVLRSLGTEKLLGKLSLQKVLMVFQFSLSLVTIIFLSAFYQQFNYIGSSEPGFEHKNILVIPFSGNADILAAEFNQVSGVEQIALTSKHFGGHTSGQALLFNNKTLSNYQKVEYYFADAALVGMMKLEIVAGENFSNSGKLDQDLLLNESASRLLGFNDPTDAVGQTFYLEDSTRVQVKGVVKDFYHRSIAHNIAPLVFRNAPEGFGEMLVKVDASATDDVAARLEDGWKKVYKDQAFKAEWLDKIIAQGNDQSASISLLGFLAFMTISIASLGLLGLVVYTVETRRKEISIRKIVGAEVIQILTLLSRGFVRLLLIAGIIAIPLGYGLSKFFLLSFVNRIDFGIGSLLLSFALLLCIGLITILSQTYKASTENPAKNLRSE